MTSERVEIMPRIEPTRIVEHIPQPAPAPATSSQQQRTIAAQAKTISATASNEYWLIGIIIVLITVVLMLIVYIVRIKQQTHTTGHHQAEEEPPQPEEYSRRYEYPQPATDPRLRHLAAMKFAPRSASGVKIEPMHDEAEGEEVTKATETASAPAPASASATPTPAPAPAPASTDKPTTPIEMPSRMMDPEIQEAERATTTAPTEVPPSDSARRRGRPSKS